METKEKIFTFPNLELKGMSEEEFDKWAETATERHNKIADLCETGDTNTLMAEMAGLGEYMTPFILITFLFGSPSKAIKRVTKEDIKRQYNYMQNPQLLEEMKEQILKEIQTLNNVQTDLPKIENLNEQKINDNLFKQ